MFELNDIIVPQTAESMLVALQQYPHLRAVIEAALATRVGSPEWEAAELAIYEASS